MEKMNLSINLERANDFHAVAEAVRAKEWPELTYDDFVDQLFTGFVRDYCERAEVRV